MAVLVTAISFLAGIAALILVLRGFDGYGAAAPNHRSNHRRPTPQVGGIAIGPIWVLAMVAPMFFGAGVPVFGDAAFLAAFGLLFALGIIDDRHAMGPVPKLLAQTVACALATTTLIDHLNVFPAPTWLSAVICFAILLAFVNLTNFIDGLDLMAVATVGVPSAGFAALSALGMIGIAYLPAGLATTALFAAFAIYNWHPARTFLGDGGSLPFGLVLGAMTVVTALEAGLVAAALLSAYILFDGGLTLLRRALRREALMHAHSTHLYQRAFRSGRPVLVVSMAAALFGAMTVTLALFAAGSGSLARAFAAVAAAAAIWAVLEWRLPIRN